MEGPGSGGSGGMPEDGPGAAAVVAARSILEGEEVVTDALVEYRDRGEPAGTEEPGLGPAATGALIEVASSLENLGAKQDELKALFESRIRSDEVQAKALERLHDQLGEYKANFIRQEMQPLLRDLIFCYDFAADEHERAARGGEPPSAQDVARAFGHLRQMVADVLSKYDVEPYRCPGPDFDRREQQCVRTVPTSVEVDEKKVAAVGAVGFRIADQIVRKEQVTVYKYAAAPRDAAPKSGPP